MAEIPSHAAADFLTSMSPADASTAPLSPKENFARRWNFGSFLEMFESSTPVGNAGGKKKWLLTSLRGGNWLLWNEVEIEAAQVFVSREEALRQMETQNAPIR